MSRTRSQTTPATATNTTTSTNTNTTTTSTTSTSLEAKLVVLGSQNVGKTSLVHRFVHNSFLPRSTPSTVGASFLTTRVHDSESATDIRLQIWDTAGQERFRSISKLYYRGAHAAVLCYDITSARSFEDMGVWLRELRDKTGLGGGGPGQRGGAGGAAAGDDDNQLIVHVVGTKSDVVALEPWRREVPFERCIGYVAEQLYPEQMAAAAGGSSAPVSSSSAGPRPPSGGMMMTRSAATTATSPPGTRDSLAATAALASPNSNRSSGFWGQEAIWDCCHEISAKDGEGIEEVFRVITRKLVEQHARKMDRQRAIEATMGITPFIGGGGGGGVGDGGYFDLPGAGTGSFRLGHGDKRRSWLGFPNTPGVGIVENDEGERIDTTRKKNGKCC